MDKIVANSDIKAQNYLSKKDEKDLKQTYELYKKGELDFISEDEIIAYTDKIIAKYNADKI